MKIFLKFIKAKSFYNKTTEEILAIEKDLAKKYSAKWNNKSVGKGDAESENPPCKW